MTILSSSVDSDLMRAIAARIGGDLACLTTVSESQYRRWSAGGPLARLRLQALAWIGHPARLAWRLLVAARGSTFVVTTNPFFAPALAAWLGAWRGHRVVNYVFDLYPDALEAAGKIPAGGFQSQVIAGVTRAAQRGCAGVVFLGPELRRHAERRYGATPAAAVIEVAADTALFAGSAEAGTGAKAPPLTLHYGGQLGAMHDAESLATAVRLLRNEREAGRVRFDFRVGGARAGHLLALDGQPGVTAGPVLPADAWRRHATGLQVGLVTLTPAGARVCLPSKTYALLAAGLAVIAVAPASSDLAATIAATDSGWVVDNARTSDPAEVGQRLAECVRQLLAEPAAVQARREAALRAARGRFGPGEMTVRWRQFLAQLDGAWPGRPEEARTRP